MNYKVGLDNLKPEVREAVEHLDESLDPISLGCCLRAHRTIHAELMRLAGIEANAVGDREDADFWKERATQAESELAALKRRIAEAPVVECPPDKPTTEDGWLQVIEWAKGVKWTKGKRVILLLDDGEGA